MNWRVCELHPIKPFKEKHHRRHQLGTGMPGRLQKRQGGLERYLDWDVSWWGESPQRRISWGLG